MPTRATANIDHAHPLRHNVVKEVELSAQEDSDLGRLRSRIQSPIQKATCVHFVIRHVASNDRKRCLTPPVSGGGERMRASRPLKRHVRRRADYVAHSDLAARMRCA
jgi:hypothetical protein